MENDFINIFIAEAEELIESLEKNVLDLEKDMTNPGGINQIFRVMHTLKGSSDMFGFPAIRELTHRLESLYAKVRDSKMKLNPELLNLTFNTIDHLRKLLTDSNLDNKETKETHEALLKRADEIGFTEKNTAVTEKQEKPASNTGNDSMEMYHILFKPNENMLKRGINILNLFIELGEIGEYVMNELPVRENEEINEWQIFIETDKGIDAIANIFMFVLEDCEISKQSTDKTPEEEKFTNAGDVNEEKDTYKVEELYNEPEQNKNLESNVDDNDSPAISGSSGQLNKKTETAAIHDDKKEHETGYNEIGRQVTSRVNVDASKLDKLMNLVSELVTTNTQLSLVNSQKEYDKLSIMVEKIESLSRQFRDNTLSIRLIPINDLMVRFRRLIRDLSQKLGKDIRFITEGTETELDKNIIDSLAEPLMHILRNAIDHGIEKPEERKLKGKPAQGVIKLSAYYEGANVYIQVQDDGAGMEPEKIRVKAIEKGLIESNVALSVKEIYDLIFMPGFSTATEVTTISGRGVGMDVVKRRIAEIQGDVSIDSEAGLGTIFTIKLHQTISIIDSLMIRTGSSYFLLPNTEVEFCTEDSHHNIAESQNQRIEYEQELIPFIYMRKLFSYSGKAPDKERLIVVNKQNQRIAIVADEIIGEHQAVIKPLGQVFDSQDFLIGASIMGNGNLAFMLDINKLILRNKNKTNRR